MQGSSRCKLVQKNSKAVGTGFLSPLLNAWDSFIKEFGLDIEWTQVKVSGKQHFFCALVHGTKAGTVSLQTPDPGLTGHVHGTVSLQTPDPGLTGHVHISTYLCIRERQKVKVSAEHKKEKREKRNDGIVNCKA
jgi:hypothetical protein